eukprot:CAMPEP_0182448952 /NCGR_PEP_ID=MMETSP1172-20130603/30992_1 /TAXON_ID=708627 /ORGANISM="Timspurckia oligopyrenoides, Strain CCMP3278" /LENGTH=129 /DNA_ID=CAMNT_0024646015 /DNA_START=99 /DNA_END=484 /DNA_ORIENTATION=-
MRNSGSSKKRASLKSFCAQLPSFLSAGTQVSSVWIQGTVAFTSNEVLVIDDGTAAVLVRYEPLRFAKLQSSIRVGSYVMVIANLSAVEDRYQQDELRKRNLVCAQLDAMSLYDLSNDRSASILWNPMVA